MNKVYKNIITLAIVLGASIPQVGLAFEFNDVQNNEAPAQQAPSGIDHQALVDSFFEASRAYDIAQARVEEEEQAQEINNGGSYFPSIDTYIPEKEEEVESNTSDLVVQEPSEETSTRIAYADEYEGEIIRYGNNYGLQASAFKAAQSNSAFNNGTILLILLGVLILFFILRASLLQRRRHRTTSVRYRQPSDGFHDMSRYNPGYQYYRG